MVLATTSEVAAIYRLRQRGPMDARAFRAGAKRLAPHQRFDTPKVVRAVSGLDVICAAHLLPHRVDYRLCFVVRRRGPLATRAVGGFRRPPGGFDEEARRYACFGRAAVLRLCGRTAAERRRILHSTAPSA